MYFKDICHIVEVIVVIMYTTINGITHNDSSLKSRFRKSGLFTKSQNNENNAMASSGSPGKLILIVFVTMVSTENGKTSASIIAR